MKLRTIAFIGMASLGGLGLIGVGAHAAFTTTTSSTQSITAGTAGIVEWSPYATNGCINQTVAVANPSTCVAVTLPLATVGSTFESPQYPVTVYNSGNVAITDMMASVTDNGANTLETELGMCLYFTSGDNVGNLLTSVEAGGPYTLSPSTLAIGTSETYYADFYAGQTDTLCNSGGVSALQGGAEGETSTVTVTVTYTG